MQNKETDRDEKENGFMRKEVAIKIMKACGTIILTMVTVVADTVKDIIKK